MANKQFNKTNLASIFLLLLSAGVATVISLVLYQQTSNILKEELKDKLRSVVATAALNFDVQNINKVHNEDDVESLAYKTIISKLQLVRNTNPSVQFAYILRPTENENIFNFIADADSLDPSAKIDLNQDGVINDQDALAWPGDEYDISEIPSLKHDAIKGATTDDEPVSDQWGTTMSAYAPIKSKGETVAVLGLDVEVTNYLNLISKTLIPFVLFIVFLLILLGLLGYELMKLWKDQVYVLKEIDTQKDELLGIVAHQLFTPVTAVKWAAEELLSDEISVMPKDKKEWAQTIQSQTVQLADLISMILDVSRIQLGKMQVKQDTLDLNEFFKEILEAVEPRALEKQTVFEKSVPKEMPVVMLDKRYTRMTIENLLTNAIKYTPDKGKVSLKVDIHNDMFTCTVTDTGCGIPKQDQDKIFGKLYRASNVRNSSIDGNGFGLYVAKGAIESQGGTITFESQEGKGTTFTVKLPLTYPTPDMTSTAQVEGAGVGKLVGA